MKLKVGSGARPRAQVEEPAPTKRAREKTGLAVLPPKDEPQETAGFGQFQVPTPAEAQGAYENSGGISFWKPQKGVNSILILPTTKEMGVGKQPWAEVKAHYCGGNDVLTALGIDTRPDDLPLQHACAKFHANRPCPWCEYLENMKKSRHKADKKLGRALFANMSCYSNIVDLGEEAAQRRIQPYRFGKRIRDQLLSELSDGKIFCHPAKLLEVRIKRTQKGKRDMDVEYRVDVITTKAVTAFKRSWLEQLADLSDYIPPVPTQDEFQEVIDLLRASADVGDAPEDVGSDMMPDYGFGGEEATEESFGSGGSDDFDDDDIPF